MIERIRPTTKEDYFDRTGNLEQAMNTKTLVELCQEAINIQNGSNLHGLATSFPKILADLKNYTNNIANHPVTRLWVSKLHDLASMGLSDMDRYAEALHQCEEIAKINL